MELSLEQQRYAILKAVEMKLVSATSLDSKAKGSRISMMKRGMEVSVEVVKRHYENLEKQIGQQEVARLLQEFQEEGKPTHADPSKDMRTQAKPARPRASRQASANPEVAKHRVAKHRVAEHRVAEHRDSFDLQGELEEANARIARLEARIVELEEEKRSLKEKLEESEKEPIKIQGWSIVQRRAGGGDYKYWYAGKSRRGRMQWIYLGKVLDLKMAKSKIEDEEKKRKRERREENE